MATIDSLYNLLISETSIKSSVNNISNMSSAINKCTKIFNNFTQNMTGLSININELSRDITDLSKLFNNLSTNVNDFSTNITNLQTMDIDIFNIGSSIGQMNDKLVATDTSSKKASLGLSIMGKLAMSALSSISFDNIKSGIDIVDQYISTSNGLASIKDKLQDQMELQNKVNTAANRSCSTYKDMANTVSKIGSLEIFSSNDETIAFAELMQKTLKVDGSDQSLPNVTEAMSDGVVQGDEYSSLTSSSPMIGDALSESTGKSMEQLQLMADQGMITSGLLKNAMFAAGDKINLKFKELPKTFADIWTRITNSAMNALNPLMQLVTDILNNPGVQAALNVIIFALGFVSQVISNLITTITDNWSLIQPILIAIGVYLAYIGGIALIGLIQTLFGVIAAEWAVIAPILLIIGLIAGVIYMFQTMGISVEDVFGFIGGVIGGAIAGIWNLILGLFEFIVGIICNIDNLIATIANTIGNIFTNPISSVIYLFQGMADCVLGIIQSIASALDFVFGTKMAETVSGWRSGLKDMADSAVAEYAPDENYQKVVDNLDLSIEDLGLSRMDYSDSIDKGKNTGKNLYRKADGFLNSMSKTDAGYDYSQFNTSNDYPGTPDDPMTVEGKGPNGSMDVDMEDEDLSYLRDMAERDYIANIATNTLAPNISVSFGDVHETADVNQLFGRIQAILKEQIAVAPEGVY